MRPGLCCFEASPEGAIRVFALEFVCEQRAKGDHLSFQADNLHDLGNPANAVAHALGVHDKVERARDLRTNCPHREVAGSHQDHILDTSQRIACGVGVNG